ncbi:hypothetical protein WEI85_02445 [Actinomycetes bacterium KLBMP 9797]
MTEIFVDTTGRRRQRVRRIAYAVGATCLLYTALVGTSVVGGATGPGALAPFPALGDHLPGRAPVRKVPAPVRPPMTATPQAEARRSPLRSDRWTPLAAPQRDPGRPAAPARRSSTWPATPVLESTPDPTPSESPSPTPTDEPEPTPTDPAPSGTQAPDPEPTLPVIELPENPMALPDPTETPLPAPAVQ